MISGANVRAVSSGSITAVGNYAVVQVGFPNVIDYATVVIRVGGAAITAGVGAWVILADDGTLVPLVVPAFAAINALTANSNNLYVWTAAGGAPVAGLGFAITTTVTGGPITRVTLTASVR
jgi:CelD/BcsL family acetyltransferase involved in cellulose biosynthesis